MAYCEITIEDMTNLMTKIGFIKIEVPNTTEVVFAKLSRIGEYTVSTRVYTTINPDGHSRDKGKDAIRVINFWRKDKDSKPKIIGKGAKCLRVTNWRENIQNAIEKTLKMELQVCPKCGSPKVERTAGNGSKFFGCVMFSDNGCKGRLDQTA
jgi:hypothetical protein